MSTQKKKLPVQKLDRYPSYLLYMRENVAALRSRKQVSDMLLHTCVSGQFASVGLSVERFSSLFGIGVHETT